MEPLESPDYILVVGNSREDEGTLAYHIMNKESSVIEYEDYMLPRTLDAMISMQDKLDEVMAKYNAPPPTVFTVVEPKKLN